ncbi:MAG: hypothetical protein HY537_10245 [Deltaproteobacteria bacterium]|nr:hypothetical protein [Deltaproteobacteria bacterium]
MFQKRIEGGSEPWFFRFRELMPFLIRRILLVSSAYDAFILEEDVPLTERLFAEYSGGRSEYSELTMLMSPTISRSDTPAHALDVLKARHFDLVITAPRLGDMDVNAFGRMVKEISPRTPVVVLTFDENDLHFLPSGIDFNVIDEVFLWNGNAKIIFAMAKQIEDRRNVVHDTQVGDVRVILLVENSIRDYTNILATLYSEILLQSQSVIADVSNALKIRLRTRSRPKVLLAKNYEEALQNIERYAANLQGVITDIRFPRNGSEKEQAGIELVQWCRKVIPDIPILLDSNDPIVPEVVRDLKIRYVNKASKDLLGQVRGFLKKELGFGSFIFRLPDETQVGKAKSIAEMEGVLKKMPLESIEYHGRRNDFSAWLNARSMFALAAKIKPYRNFDDIEVVRRYLIDVIHEARAQEEEGCVIDITRSHTIIEPRLVRLGAGSTGGKGRGIAFVYSLLTTKDAFKTIEGIEIQIPKTLVIGADEFDHFCESNSIASRLASCSTDKDVLQIFLDSHFPRNFVRDLRMASESLKGPIGVRSSGLLEDSHFLPFAGIYSTYLLPNSDSNAENRFRELQKAIKAVYASTFQKKARDYLASTPYRVENEKMAIVIQELVGQQYQDRFYPLISGVAISHNFYPVGSQKPEEGVAILALGLGKTVVEGRKAVRFSPGAPGVQLPFSSARELYRNSQTTFFALDLSKKRTDFLSGEDSTLKICELEQAEQDGTLGEVGSVYCPSDDVIRENLQVTGPRVVTFNNILKWKSMPLATALTEILQTMRHAFGCDVEIEFAVEYRQDGEGRIPCLYVLQIRPLSGRHIFQQKVDPASYPRERLLCSTDWSLGNGVINDLYDLVYVEPELFNSWNSMRIATEVEKITDELRSEKRPFLLIGPGRWGTNDPNLGIPVQWGQIAGVKVIVETGLKNRTVEPSDGTHFYQNILSMGVGYLYVSGMKRYSDLAALLDFAWLKQQSVHAKSTHVCHVRFSNPLACYLEGARGNAVILKPDPL